MSKKIAAAVFKDRDHAERAVDELRDAGAPKDKISIIQLHDDEDRHDRDDEVHVEHVDHDTKASGTGKGLAAGGAVGAIAGFSALLIPGVGPFLAAGAFAEALGVVGSAAVTSGLVGAAAGGLTGALIDYGIDEDRAKFYEKRVKEGAVLVTVDTSNEPSAYGPVRGILRASGGEMAESDEREYAEEHDRTHA